MLPLLSSFHDLGKNKSRFCIDMPDKFGYSNAVKMAADVLCSEGGKKIP